MKKFTNLLIEDINNDDINQYVSDLILPLVDDSGKHYNINKTINNDGSLIIRVNYNKLVNGMDDIKSHIDSLQSTYNDLKIILTKLNDDGYECKVIMDGNKISIICVSDYSDAISLINNVVVISESSFRNMLLSDYNLELISLEDIGSARLYVRFYGDNDDLVKYLEDMDFVDAADSDYDEDYSELYVYFDKDIKIVK